MAARAQRARADPLGRASAGRAAGRRPHVAHALGLEWQLQHRGTQLQAVCAPCRVQLRRAAWAGAAAGVARVAAGAARGRRALRRHAVARRGGSPDRDPVQRAAAAARRRPAAVSCRPRRWPRWWACSDTTWRKPSTVRATGTLAFVATARWPEGTWQAKPVVQDFSVDGLGTERLLTVQLPPACRTTSGDGTPLTGWLPRALVAAEDATTFFEHPGYEIDQLLAAGQHNQRDGAPLRGASTLTQQLAKLTITGDDRTRRPQAARTAVRRGDGAHARQGAHPADVPGARAVGRRRLRRRARGAGVPGQERVEGGPGVGRVAGEPAAQPRRAAAPLRPIP